MGAKGPSGHRPERRAESHEYEAGAPQELKVEHAIDAALWTAPDAHDQAACEHAATRDGNDHAQDVTRRPTEDHGRDEGAHHAPEKVDDGEKDKQTQ